MSSSTLDSILTTFRSGAASVARGAASAASSVASGASTAGSYAAETVYGMYSWGGRQVQALAPIAKQSLSSINTQFWALSAKVSDVGVRTITAIGDYSKQGYNLAVQFAKENPKEIKIAAAGIAAGVVISLIFQKIFGDND